MQQILQKNAQYYGAFSAAVDRVDRVDSDD